MNVDEGRKREVRGDGGGIHDFIKTLARRRGTSRGIGFLDAWMLEYLDAWDAE